MDSLEQALGGTREGEEEGPINEINPYPDDKYNGDNLITLL